MGRSVETASPVKNMAYRPETVVDDVTSENALYRGMTSSGFTVDDIWFTAEHGRWYFAVTLLLAARIISRRLLFDSTFNNDIQENTKHSENADLRQGSPYTTCIGNSRHHAGRNQ